MRTFLLAFALVLAGCAHGPERPPREALADWHGKFPLAAQDLCATERVDPVITQRLLQWEHDNPAVAQDLIDWGATHPGEPLPAFFRDHPSVQADAWFWGNDAPPRILLRWAQRHPDAAQARADQPDVLTWAAAHRSC